MFIHAKHIQISRVVVCISLASVTSLRIDHLLPPPFCRGHGSQTEAAVLARARAKRAAPPPVDPLDPDPSWVLSHIVKQAPSEIGGQILYLVRYEGYGPEDDLWLSETDLEDAPELAYRMA
jgi:hypothetical protein